MNKVKLAITCVIVVLTHASFGQSVVKDTKKIADNYYSKADYSSAAKYYAQAIGGNSDKEKNNSPYQLQPSIHQTVTDKAVVAETMYQLAESYRLLNDHLQAEVWYAKLIQTNPSAYPLASLYYGSSLRANGKYAVAETELKKFITDYNKKDVYQQQAQDELADLAFIQQQKLQADVTVTKFGDNETGGNYAASWMNNSTIVFTSTRVNQNATSEKSAPVNALYTATYQDKSLNAVAALTMPITGEKENGVATVSADGNRLYFTGWSVGNDGVKKSAIYVSHKSNGVWEAPVKVPSNINSDSYNARQPSITADGKYLFFASDMPGGKGGFDVWYAPLDAGGQPGNAINAGAAINTKGNEEAPFYHAATSTLIFASNGKVGMGGYDLYAAKGETINWSEAVNLGAPVNSIKDDLYFASHGNNLLEDAIISSDRSSQCCLELFAIHKASAVTETAVVSPNDKTPVIEPAKETPATVVTATPETTKEIAIPDKTKLTEKHILFAFNDVAIDESSAVYLNEVVAFLKENPETKIEIGAYTDGKGTAAYNQILSVKRAKACADYLLAKGIAKQRLTAKGYGECCPIEPETTADGEDVPEAREKNRRLQIKVIGGNR